MMESPDLQCLEFLQKDGRPNRFGGHDEVFSDSRRRGTGGVGWSVKIHTPNTIHV